MTILSTLRAASYLARDIWPALQRLATPPDDDNPDAYAEHLAKLRAEALAEREAQTEVTEPLSDCGLGEADECLCGEDGGLSCDSCRGNDEVQVGTPLLTRVMQLCQPQPPSAADEPAFTEWLASIDARLAAIQDHLTSAAPGDTFTPDAAPESPAPDPGAGAGQPGISNLDWALIFVGLEHLTRLSSDPDQWKALSDRISDALARSK